MSLFKFSAKPIVTWPVVINVPLDGGVTRQIKIRAKFEILTSPEHNEIYDGGGTDHDLLRRVLKDWEGMPGSDDQPVQFSPEALEEAIAMPFVRASFIEAYVNASVGKAAARKN